MYIIEIYFKKVEYYLDSYISELKVGVFKT